MPNPSSSPTQYEFKGFGVMDVTTPYQVIWFGDRRSPKPYEFMGSIISNTPMPVGGRAEPGRTGPIAAFFQSLHTKPFRYSSRPAPVRPFLGGRVHTIPAAQKALLTGSGPPVGMGLWAVGAVWTPKVYDFQSVQKPCIGLPCVRPKIPPPYRR